MDQGEYDVLVSYLRTGKVSGHLHEEQKGFSKKKIEELFVKRWTSLPSRQKERR